jgi:hypothetical protein
MRYSHLTVPAAVLVGLALLLPARAADINDLEDTYVGRVHHSSIASEEDDGIAIGFDNQQPNGTFTGNIGFIPISGKVTSAGVITFSGSANGKGGSVQIKKGTGQLSATGRFIVGSFQYKGTGVDTPGKYTFHVDSEP